MRNLYRVIVTGLVCGMMMSGGSAMADTSGPQSQQTLITGPAPQAMVYGELDCNGGRAAPGNRTIYVDCSIVAIVSNHMVTGFSGLTCRDTDRYTFGELESSGYDGPEVTGVHIIWTWGWTAHNTSRRSARTIDCMVTWHLAEGGFRNTHTTMLVVNP
jgi:hypothetical protein